MAFFVAHALLLEKAVKAVHLKTQNKKEKANGHVKSEIAATSSKILTSASNVKNFHVKNSKENYSTPIQKIQDFNTDMRFLKTLKNSLNLA